MNARGKQDAPYELVATHKTPSATNPSKKSSGRVVSPLLDKVLEKRARVVEKRGKLKSRRQGAYLAWCLHSTCLAAVVVWISTTVTSGCNAPLIVPTTFTKTSH